jgi:hypothetical protein
VRAFAALRDKDSMIHKVLQRAQSHTMAANETIENTAR